MNMTEQYREAKKQHPDMLLLFRMGDFYEAFSVDANTLAKTLGLTVTLRRPMKDSMDSGNGEGVLMSGFPHHQLESYLHKLLVAGYRVAILDQVK